MSTVKDQIRTNVIDNLNQLLASTYTLYLKTQNYHWNVTGPWFQSLHLLFEQQYKELALAVDEVAEHIRTLGVRAPGSYSVYAKTSVIKEAGDQAIDAEQMLKDLIADQQIIIDLIKSAMAVCADDSAYQTTIDLFVRRSQVHEKSLWMLRSSLG